MLSVKYCILGAGPSGLTFASSLKSRGETSFVLLEKEAEAGGLCRSKIVDDSPLDIGGGHFLDVRRDDVLDFLFEFMPREEWQEFDRVSKIRLRGQQVDHPLEGNIWQFETQDQVDFLESIARAGCVNDYPQPDMFSDWIRWKLGSKIADEYMLPYNRKMWGEHFESLGVYWLYKLPDVSFRETLESCLLRKAGGKLPAHGKFLYPKKFGYGEVWSRIAESLGDQYVGNYTVDSIDPFEKTINNSIRYETLVTTIPWPIWSPWDVLPFEVEKAVSELKHTSVDVDYHSDICKTNAHWTYEPSEKVPHHRYLFRSNFCTGARGYWVESNANRSSSDFDFRHHNEYAYPVSTIGKPRAIQTVKDWANKMNIIPLGRWGTWEHMNSDIAVHLALEAAKKIVYA